MTSTRFIPVCSVTPGDYSNVKKISGLDDLSWKLPHDHEVSTHHSSHKLSGVNMMKMETQTLYFMDPNSKLSGLIQILYSKVLNNLYKGFQINFKVFSHDQKKNEEYQVWLSSHISGVDFIKQPLKDEKNGKYHSFLGVEGHNIRVHFSETSTQKGVKAGHDGIKYITDIHIPKKGLSIKLESVLGEGFCIQPDGCSYYLDRPASSSNTTRAESKPATSEKYVRHVFVPSGKCNGVISYMNENKTRKEITLWEVPILYIDATQTLLPSKSASQWNFLCFKGFNYTLMVMEFLTTVEYGSVKLSVWSISKGDTIVEIGSHVNDNSIVQFTETKMDTNNNWKYPVPIAIKFNFPTSSNDELIIKDLNLVKKFSIVDELPSIARQVALKIMDLHPYLYQYCQKCKFRGEDGVALVETTFVS